MFNEPFGGVIPGARGAVLAALMRTGTPMTGRRVHGLVSDDHSLWSVQQVLKDLAAIGLVRTESIGRAGVHEINEGHSAVAPLMTLLDPIDALRKAVDSVARADANAVSGVILFGSIARGDAGPGSDIDLAVIATAWWDRRIELKEHVATRLGNDCDVVVFTRAEFTRLAAAGEPVVVGINRDGVALFGEKPHVRDS